MSEFLAPVVQRFVADVKEFVAGSTEALKANVKFGESATKAGEAAQRASLVAESAAQRVAKAQLAAANAAVKAGEAQARTAEISQKVASGEMEAAEAAKLETAAMNAQTKATLAAKDAALANERAQLTQAAAEDKAAAASSGLAARAATVSTALTGMGKISTLAFAGIGYESVKSAAKFQQSMTQVHTQAGYSIDEINRLSKAVLDLGPRLGSTPDELAQSLYHVASAGVPASEAMDLVTNATKLAKIGNTDFDSSTQAMIAVVASGIKGVNGYADAAAILNKTVGIGDMRMSQLTRAMSSGIVPAAKTAGLSMEDVSAALAVLTDNAVPADEAATRLKTTFSMMEAPTNKAIIAYQKIGMSQISLANDMRKPDGFLVAIQDLHDHLEATYPAAESVKLSSDQIKTAMTNYGSSLKDMGLGQDEINKKMASFKTSLEQNGSAAVKQGQAISAMFGGGRMSATIQTELEELDRLKSKYPAIGDATKRAADQQEAWRATQKNFTFQMDALKASAEKLGIEIGTKLIPVILRIVGFFERHKTVTGDLALALLALMGLSVAVWFGTLAVSVGNAVVATVKFGYTVGSFVVKQVALAIWEVGKFVVELAVSTVRATGQAALGVGRLALSMGGSLVRGAIMAARAMAVFTASLLTNPIFLIVAAVVAVAVAIYELWKHWNQVWSWVMHHKAYAAIIAFLFPIVIPIFAIVAAGKYLQKHWGEIWSEVKSILSSAWSWIKSIFGDFVGGIEWVGRKIGGLLSDVNKVAKAISNPVGSVSHLLGFADGGSPPVGQAVLVGERGPELAVFGSPAYIHPAGETRRMIAGGKASGGWVGSPSSWSSPSSSGTTTVVVQPPPDIVLQVDGQTLFRIVQREALRNGRRNIGTGLTFS